MHKRVLSLMLAAVLLIGLLGCSAGNETSAEPTPPAATETPAPVATDPVCTPGTYTGEAQGYGGTLKVSVTVGEAGIQAIDILEHNESLAIGSQAVEKLTKLMASSQSLGVDTLSGATVSSHAAIAAVTDALSQAGADIDALKANPASQTLPAKDTETDVVIIGAGGAGLSAAFTLQENGVRNFIVLEKRGIAGGNAATATKLDTGGTQVQARLGSDFSLEDAIAYSKHKTEIAGHTPNDEFVDFYVHQSSLTIDWLDATFQPEFARTSGSEIYGGAKKLAGDLTDRMIKATEEAAMDIRYNHRAVKLIKENGAVTGVEVSTPNGNYTIRAKAVLIATGSYCRSDELLARFAPEWAGSETTHVSGSTGDGILMAEEVGAGLAGMDSLVIEATLKKVNGTTIMAGQIRYNGGILVDKINGKRFANEMAPYTVIGLAEKALPPDGTAWGVLDSESEAAVSGYGEDVLKADTIEELAVLMGIEPANLKKTLEDYQSYIAAGSDPEFGKTDFRGKTMSSPPYYAIPVFPGMQNADGGITINLNAQVLDTAGNVIPGLYAAGDAAFNHFIQSEYLTAAYTFGRVAANHITSEGLA